MHENLVHNGSSSSHASPPSPHHPPSPPLSFEWGWRSSCTEEVQLQQLAHTEEQRKPETSPQPILLLSQHQLSPRDDRLLPKVTGLGREGIYQTNQTGCLACFLSHPETFAYDGTRDAALRLAHRISWQLKSLYQLYEIHWWCSGPHDEVILESPGVPAFNPRAKHWSSRTQAWSNVACLFLPCI